MSITKSNTRMLEGEDLTLTGDLGIGTSTPSTYNGQLVNYKDTGSGTFLGHANGSGTFPKVSAIGMGSDAVSFTHTSNGATYALSGSAQIAAIQSAASGAPTDLAFYTNSSGSVTERMRIKNSGAVDIGGFATTGAVDGVQINGDGSGIQSKAASTGFSYHNRFYNSNGQVGYISTQNSTTVYNTSSDYRLKTDAQPMTGATARLKALNPVNFEWIADGTRVDGFLAHEAQAVVPESVTGTKDEVDDEGNPVMQGIDQAKLVPLLTAALQEAIAKIEVLETKVAALEA